MANAALPTWLTAVVVPVVNVAVAFLAAGLVVALIGENPLTALSGLMRGAFGSSYGIGYTLFYTTSFIFTGLAVAVAFHAGHFNIGGEGQALMGGLGAALVALGLPDLPALLLVPLCVLGAAAGGAIWAFLPGWLQARRGSHIVITTIMFNFIASTLLVYLLVGPMKMAGSMAPETAQFPPAALLASAATITGWFGWPMTRSPLNLSFALALAAAFAVWLLIWRTRLGYAIRTVGANPEAARYAGLSPARITIVALVISGALAGLMATNEILGSQGRLINDFTAGAGFVGIAVALMGRGHPFGIVLAALLFGALTQGGAELAFEMPAITRDMIVVIQGFVILFAGALESLFADRIAQIYRRVRPEAA
ncbi:ABC transporter permease [Phreatobacter aquaticus]|uniref:ABC transporter permease n=1 Tax=Phreatobacter aquaticus TaxID=2570229 RepID=A0A4D7QEF3_9HYPH|nr:ABC transporter permease [Phreatobacter aquaticus]QCK85145.1 ABC transporter permease [Phreatobacter aquaticus]